MSVCRSERRIDAAYPRNIKDGFRDPAITIEGKDRGRAIIGSGKYPRAVRWDVTIDWTVVARHGRRVLREGRSDESGANDDRRAEYFDDLGHRAAPLNKAASSTLARTGPYGAGSTLQADVSRLLPVSRAVAVPGLTFPIVHLHVLPTARCGIGESEGRQSAGGERDATHLSHRDDFSQGRDSARADRFAITNSLFLLPAHFASANLARIQGGPHNIRSRSPVAIYLKDLPDRRAFRDLIF
jgi:hypothetical protein